MFWNTISWWMQALKNGKIDTQPDEDERPDPPDRTPGLEPDVTEPLDLEPDVTEPGKIGSIGAWTGWGSIVSNTAIARDLKFAKGLGLGRLDVIVNDHSAKRQPMDFGTYNKSRLIAFCQAANKEGFAVHLMTWWMPHEQYIKEGGKQLVNLVADCGARSIMIDAEEPWTRAVRPMPYAAGGQTHGRGAIARTLWRDRDRLHAG